MHLNVNCLVIEWQSCSPQLAVIVSCNYILLRLLLPYFLTGPFWICTTLVFTTAIAGNMASYLSVEGKDFTWKYDFHKGILKS